MINWPKGRTISTFKKKVLSLEDVILHGSFLCVDPGSGASSTTGFAIYSHCQLVESGTVELRRGDPLDVRLKKIYDKTNELQQKYDSKLLVVEMVRGRMLHPSLHYAVGVSIAGIGVPVIEIPISVWKVCCPDDYEKGDEADAIQFGNAIIKFCKHYRRIG